MELKILHDVQKQRYRESIQFLLKTYTVVIHEIDSSSAFRSLIETKIRIMYYMLRKTNYSHIQQHVFSQKSRRVVFVCY